MNNLIKSSQKIIFNSQNKNSVVYFLTAIFGALLGFLTLPIFTNILTKEDIAIFGFGMALNSFFLPIISLSLESFFLKKNPEIKDLAEKKKLLSTLVFATLLWSIIIIALLLILTPIILNLLGVKIKFFPNISILCLSNFMLVFYSFKLLKYRIEGRVWRYFFLSSFQNILITCFSLFFILYIYNDVYGRVLGTSIGILIMSILCVFILKKDISIKCFNFKILKESLKFSIPLVFYSLTFFFFDLIDRFFIEKYCNLNDLANFNIAFQFASITVFVSNSLFRAYEPDFFKLYAEKEEKTLVKKMINLNFINFIFCILLILLSNFIILKLTNESYRGSIFIAQLLIFAFFTKSLFLNCNTILTAQNKNNLLMSLSFVGLILVFGFNIFFGNQYKVLGTSLSKIVTYLILFIFANLILIKSQKYFITFFFNSIILLIAIFFSIFFLTFF